MMITVGSLNKTKINAVKAVFTGWEVMAIDASSDVSDQPIGDQETRMGAIHRAKNVRNMNPGSIGIGLEGGIMWVDDELYLCNWGALVTVMDDVYTASGARIRLPDSFKAPLLNGEELSMVMDKYTNKQHIRHHEGAIGIFTNGRVLRDDMFTHVVQLLKGQLEYWK